VTASPFSDLHPNPRPAAYRTWWWTCNAVGGKLHHVTVGGPVMQEDFEPAIRAALEQIGIDPTGLLVFPLREEDL